MPNVSGGPKEGSITLTLKEVETGGGLVSVATLGDWASEEMHLKFYSVAELPPDDFSPEGVWGNLLRMVAGFMLNP